MCAQPAPGAMPITQLCTLHSAHRACTCRSIALLVSQCHKCVGSRLLQLYNASANPPTKLGDPVVLNITSGSGTAGSPYVATVGPFAQPLRITAAVQATGGAGSVSTALSAQSTPVVVGEWPMQIASMVKQARLLLPCARID